MGSSQVQGSLWGTYAEDWAYRAEPTTAPLWKAILAATYVGPGIQLLDVGCGGGGLVAVADKLGASISGLDASENLITIAKARVPKGSFFVGDFENLPFEESCFDVVTACNVLQFVEDRDASLSEVRRTMKPGAKFAVGMWAEPERCQMAIVFKIIQSFAPQMPHSGRVELPSLTDRNNLISMLESANFNVESEGDVECVFEYSSIEEAWLAFRSAGMIVAAAKSIGEKELGHAVKGALGEVSLPDGSIRLSNWFRYVVAS